MNKRLLIAVALVFILSSVLCAEDISKTDGNYRHFFRENKEIAKWTIYNDGKIDKNGQAINGVFKEYDNSDKIISETTYVNNVEHGPYKIYSYDKSGILKIEVGEYKNGIKQGKYKIYYGDGKINEEGTYKDGQFDGKIKTYYRTGTIFSVFTMKNGMMQGKAQKFYQDGKLKEEAEFMQNKFHGSYKVYYPNGKINKDETYKFGVLIKHKVYNLQGELIENTKYEYNKPEQTQQK